MTLVLYKFKELFSKFDKGSIMRNVSISVEKSMVWKKKRNETKRIGQNGKKSETKRNEKLEKRNERERKKNSRTW
jgi:hypothetical protein